MRFTIQDNPEHFCREYVETKDLNADNSGVDIWNTLRKKGPYSELFWSAFYSVRMRTRITPNTDAFYAVCSKYLVQDCLHEDLLLITCASLFLFQYFKLFYNFKAYLKSLIQT